jgi:hypothetical protein
MEEAGMLSTPAEGDSEAAYAREVLVYAISVVRNGNIIDRERLAAARMVLEFTLSRPTAKATVALHDAETLLGALADEYVGHQ